MVAWGHVTERGHAAPEGAGPFVGMVGRLAEGPASTAPARPDRLARLLSWLAAPPSLGALVVALLLCLPVPLLSALAPRAAVNYTLHDVFIPIDAAWRSLQGQRPHVDFYTPIGVVYFWLHGAAAWLWGMDARVVIWASLLALPPILILGAVLAWRRLGTLSAVLLMLMLTALVAAPTFIDGPPFLVAHLANYNRLDWALSSLVCLRALCGARGESRGWDMAETLAIGGVLFLLFYLKLTYFLYSVGVLAIGCVVTRGLWRRAVLALVACAAGGIVLELLQPGLLGAYRADVARAAAANTVLMRGYAVERAIEYNATPGLLDCLLVGLDLWLLPAWRLAILGVAAAAASSVLLATQNWGGFAPPLVVLLMILAEWLPQGAGPSRADTRAALLTLGVGTAVLATLPFVLTQANGTLAHVVLARGGGGGGHRVDDGSTETFRNMRWYTNSLERYEFPKDFDVEEVRRWGLKPQSDAMQAVLADGYGLIARLGVQRARIENVAFSNPFPAGLRWPSPRGVALWWDVDRTFVPGKLTPEQVVGDADVVMVPKVWQDIANSTALEAVVHPALEAGFAPHESRYWTAWVRR